MNLDVLKVLVCYNNGHKNSSWHNHRENLLIITYNPTVALLLVIQTLFVWISFCSSWETYPTSNPKDTCGAINIQAKMTNWQCTRKMGFICELDQTQGILKAFFFVCQNWSPLNTLKLFNYGNIVSEGVLKEVNSFLSKLTLTKLPKNIESNV